jgi:hypothetical protein
MRVRITPRAIRDEVAGERERVVLVRVEGLDQRRLDAVFRAPGTRQ